MKVYIKNGWNKMDILGISLFIAGFSVHIIAEFTNDTVQKNNIFDISRCIIYQLSRFHYISKLIINF